MRMDQDVMTDEKFAELYRSGKAVVYFTAVGIAALQAARAFQGASEALGSLRISPPSSAFQPY